MGMKSIPEMSDTYIINNIQFSFYTELFTAFYRGRCLVQEACAAGLDVQQRVAALTPIRQQMRD